MDFQNIIISVFAVLLIVLIPMLFLFVKVYVRKTDLGIEKQKIELEMFRRSLENTIYSATDKMVSDKERWKDVNHMIFEAAKKNIHTVENNENQFLESLSINRASIEVDHDKAFLLAPINPRFEEQVNIIKAACDDLGINCETADEEYISGPILSVIIKKMLSASLIIAVIDGRNPNVFYELGLAHAFGKTVVMISGGLENIPFDIQSQRMVIVDWKKTASMEKIRKSLAESIRWANKRL
ncbi:hypothetical protein LSB85_001217 [Salmonella enterica]|nr:hypothetical protein [Salmonella enterica]